MISEQELETLIREAFPDAQTEIADKTGMRDHYLIRVVSGRFADMNLLDRHRSVMQTLQPAMSDGRLHAAEIQTALPG